MINYDSQILARTLNLSDERARASEIRESKTRKPFGLVNSLSLLAFPDAGMILNKF